MKYKQLENLEIEWKWAYLIKKYNEGSNVTRYINNSEIQAITNTLLSFKHEPTKVVEWISEYMAPKLDKKLKQAIRAKRKRYFNAEQEHTRKKSIDLDFKVWEKLSTKAHNLDATLSYTIEYLLGEVDRSQNTHKKLASLKKDLSRLLAM
ncbi:macrodomain Ter protein MatP [Candidatus Enterovibrio escicola]|uniref:macrodomain Ter protein MatP n=1 Tax=Candidatus Enterovibrio escicola TaxID=1927127 RepID=UPI000BE41A7E|nr:macrodomain Ter protein MatP [Candidatus Enterovibrio escacola]